MFFSKEEPKTKRFAEVGATGLKQFSGYVQEEFLQDLKGKEGIRTYKEMADNDPTVGAILFATETILRGVTWMVEPASADPADEEVADFVNTCRDDMSHSWTDFISEVTSMLSYGWAYHEIVYKRRMGPRQKDGAKRSKYNDGMIGWRKLPIRSQDSLLRWEFDDDDGSLRGMEQQTITGQHAFIPIEKSLLFRTTTKKNNPEGRALCPETPIPTPDGWRKIDNLQVGDKVFDENGKIRYVVAKADWEDRPCYKIKYSDDTYIIADANHEWLTKTAVQRSSKKDATIKTTEEMASSVRNNQGISNHSIAWAKPLEYTEQYYILHPYYLGLWLGDGTSRNSDITCHVDDVDETSSILNAIGINTRIVHNGRPNGNGRLLKTYGSKKWASDSPAASLRHLGLIKNKHIPKPYMIGSIKQRMDFLSGLMDSDGHVDKHGRCEFTNTNKLLAKGCLELIRSLGCGARMTSKINSHGNTAYLVKFTPTFTPFKLQRKIDKCKATRQRTNHYVVDIKKVENRRTVCIEVDSPSHLFIAGEGIIPTHNSILRSAYKPYFYKKRIENYEAIGIERDLAGLPVIGVDAELMVKATEDTDEGAAAKAALDQYKAIGQNIRNDEQACVIMPLAYDDNNNKLFTIELMSSGGSRQFDTNAIINRYDSRIAQTILADFILIGQGSVGTQSLAEVKIDLFMNSLTTWLNVIEDTFNRFAIPRLMYVNNIDQERSPKLKAGAVKKQDVEKLINSIKEMVDSTVLEVDEELEGTVKQALEID